MMQNSMVVVIVVMALIQSLEGIELAVREDHYGGNLEDSHCFWEGKRKQVE